MKEVEEKWFPVLLAQCRDIFSNTFIPSHDESHHSRVWSFAKQFMQELEKNNFSFDKKKIESVIFSVFFHDTGMSVQPDPEHGKHSRKIAEEFFTHTFRTPFDGMDEVLTVIEKHDDKDYQASKANQSHSPDGLFYIVNASDDLDALGIVGIYRYAEIYLMQGVEKKDLSGKILENSRNRFQFFLNNYGFLSRFAEQQMIRYQILQKFYNDLILQQKTGNVSEETGPTAVINKFEQLILTENIPLQQVFQRVENESKDPYVLDFFRLLKEEMDRGSIQL